MSSVNIYNKKARHDYQISETLEAGLVLVGDEVKKIRSGKVQIANSYARPLVNKNKDQELWLINSHIEGEDPTRSRKILLKRSEIDHLIGKISQQNVTIIPLKLYSRRGIIKIELGLAKGKKQFDKREDLKRKDLERQLKREGVK